MQCETLRGRDVGGAVPYGAAAAPRGRRQTGVRAGVEPRTYGGLAERGNIHGKAGEPSRDNIKNAARWAAFSPFYYVRGADT